MLAQWRLCCRHRKRPSSKPQRASHPNAHPSGSCDKQAAAFPNTNKLAKAYPCWTPASCRSYWRKSPCNPSADVDAAILFSDIVVPLKAAGIDVDIVPGRGPVMAAPIRTRADIDALPILDTKVEEVAQGIALINEELTPTQALIGFVGAPFTLASYLIEGGPSKNHERTKALMHDNPDDWHALMERLVPTITTFLRTQLDAGIDAMQLFDSWVGFLPQADYRTHVLPYSQRILASVRDAGYSIPRIHFGVGTGELLGAMAEAGPDVVGVDWRIPLDVAASRITAASQPKVLQGNLDPALLFASEDALRTHINRIKDEAARAIAAGNATGHIFNLGHGVLPTTDADAITRAVEIIHEER